MHLPIGHPGHLGDFDDESNIHLEELHASRLQVDSGSGSEGSQGSRGSGGCIREKPVKVIPCPRCQSMNTKFCYYNNYSVNQPRHFCRNCQRYWTVGGTLRNVPVGGGSRKKTRSRSRSGNDNNNNNNYFQAGVGPNPPPGLANPGASQFPGLDTLRQLSMLSQSQQQQHQVGLGFHSGQLGGLIPSPHSQIPFLQFGLEPTQGMSFSSQLLSKPEPTDHLHSLFDTNSAGGLLQSNSSGYYMPEVEPSSHSEALATVMQKAGLWSNLPGNHHHHHHQVHQPCASEVAWEEMQSKSSPINPPAPAAFKFEETRASNLNSNSNSNNSSTSSAVLHPPSKPGFWETALMHSRPPAMERPSPGMHAWDDSAQHRSNNLSPHASSSTEEGGTSSTPSTGGYASTGLFGDAAASPWGGLQLQQLNVPPEIYF